jgi:hypothetical protein
LRITKTRRYATVTTKGKLGLQPKCVLINIDVP